MLLFDFCDLSFWRNKRMSWIQTHANKICIRNLLFRKGINMGIFNKYMVLHFYQTLNLNKFVSFICQRKPQR